RRTISRWSDVSSEALPSPRSTVPASSTSRICAGPSRPLSTPLRVMARRRGSRATTALRLPLVPSIQPRRWKAEAVSTSSWARSERRSATGRVYQGGLRNPTEEGFALSVAEPQPPGEGGVRPARADVKAARGIEPVAYDRKHPQARQRL